MPLNVNWNGDIIESPASENLRTQITGTFTSMNGITTYFPLPMSFASSVPIIGKYRVSSAYVNRPDLIAQELYSSSDLWWLVYWSNGTIDPFTGPIAGDILNIIDIVKFRSLFNK